MSLLRVVGITKNSGSGFLLSDINIEQQAYQKIALAGETGSGKSTLLKIIAGLVQADSGMVLLEDVKVQGPLEQLLPGHPRIAYLSQHFELRNHYRVEELLGMANKIAPEDAREIYEVCQISHLLKRKTNQLSGGEKQRIALAQLLTTAPKLLLLDEPFSNLDLIHKSTLKNVLEEIGSVLNITCILASHDPHDILAWADELIILKDGKVIQQGLPIDLYFQPASEYVAGLLGYFNKILASDVRVFLPINNALLEGKYLLIRPDSLILTGNADGNKLAGKIQSIRFSGSYFELRIAIKNQTILVTTMDNFYEVGDSVFISIRPGCSLSILD